MGYGENVPDVIETLTDVCIQATASLMIQRSSPVIVQSLFLPNLLSPLFFRGICRCIIA